MIERLIAYLKKRQLKKIRAEYLESAPNPRAQLMRDPKHDPPNRRLQLFHCNYHERDHVWHTIEICSERDCCVGRGVHALDDCKHTDMHKYQMRVYDCMVCTGTADRSIVSLFYQQETDQTPRPVAPDWFVLKVAHQPK
jgi:hypothetical protein